MIQAFEVHARKGHAHKIHAYEMRTPYEMYASAMHTLGCECNSSKHDIVGMHLIGLHLTDKHPVDASCRRACYKVDVS